jgi:hypothetical protein
MLLATLCLLVLLVPGADAQGPCSIFRSWNTGDTLTASDLTSSMVTVGQTNMEPSCVDGLGDDATQFQGTADPFPSGTESLPATLKDELERLRFVIKKLSGWSQWYTHSEQVGIPNFNYTFNGDVEIWGGGTSAAPTGWAPSGAGATVAKDTTNKKVGTASVALTRSGADAAVTQLAHNVFHGIEWWKNKTVTLGCWVRATVAARARLRINDGISSNVSALHPGDSAWRFLTVTYTVSSSATQLALDLLVVDGDTTAQFDGAILVVGPTVSDFIPSGWRGRKSLIHVNSSLTGPSGGSTVYLVPAGHSALELFFELPFAKAILRRLVVKANPAPGGGQSYTYTVRVGAVDTTIATVIADSSDFNHDLIDEKEVTLAAAQFVSVKLVTSGGAAVAYHTAMLEVEEIP